MASVFGIDYGHKKVGVAVGQTVTKTAQPLKVIKQNGEFWQQLNKLISDWQPNVFVIGKPMLADGKEHPLESAIQHFIELINQDGKYSIYRIDEAFSSVEASYYTDSSHLDAHAAAIILETWLQENY